MIKYREHRLIVTLVLLPAPAGRVMGQLCTVAGRDSQSPTEKEEATFLPSYEFSLRADGTFMVLLTPITGLEWMALYQTVLCK